MFTSNLIGSLDSAFIDRCCLEEEVNTPATECVFEILRKEINGLLQCGIVFCETMIYEAWSDSTVTTRASTPNLIPSRQWANIHWPSTATTAVSELYRIAMLAKGLSGRKLKGLVTNAQYKYLVDEPSDLRDLLVALEAVIRKATRQRTNVGKQEEEAAANESDVAKFLTNLEADENANGMNS